MESRGGAPSGSRQRGNRSAARSNGFGRRQVYGRYRRVSRLASSHFLFDAQLNDRFDRRGFLNCAAQTSLVLTIALRTLHRARRRHLDLWRQAARPLVVWVLKAILPSMKKWRALMLALLVTYPAGAQPEPSALDDFVQSAEQW